MFLTKQIYPDIKDQKLWKLFGLPEGSIFLKKIFFSKKGIKVLSIRGMSLLGM